MIRFVFWFTQKNFPNANAALMEAECVVVSASEPVAINEKNLELNRLNQFMIGRELKVQELEREYARLT